MSTRQQRQAWHKYERERRQQREAVIAEFATEDTDVTLHAMAEEILRSRDAMAQLARAVAWAQAGAPFAMFGPGPYWQPRPPHDTSALLDGTAASQ